jgi:serine/threonine protein kinase
MEQDEELAFDDISSVNDACGLADPGSRFQVKSSVNMEHDMELAYDGISSVIDVCGLPEPGSRFEIKNLAGEGTYGEVYEAKDTETGKEVRVIT